MKVSALEVRVGDKFFAIEMDKVKHFFDIENILKMPSLPNFVEGIVRYNNYVYPLISLKKAWNIEDNNLSNTAVAIVYEGLEYAVLIDEIVKVEELEKKENFLLEVFEEEGKLIGNLNLDFLKNVNIPTFNNLYVKEVSKIDNDTESFLLFKCNDEILGIDTKVIKKVEDIVNRNTLIINDVVIKLFEFEKLYKECSYQSTIILEHEKVLGLLTGEIIDIYIVPKDKITISQHGIFNRFTIFNSQEVKIFSNSYLEKFVDKYGVHIPKEDKKLYDESTEVLILNIAGDKFAVRMENVVDIAEYNEGHLHFANDNPYVKGILTTKEGATFIISLEKLLNKEIKVDEETKIIVLKDNKIKAMLVSKIEDLIHLKKEQVIVSDSDNYIGGMVLLENEMIPLLNIKWPKDL